MKTFTNELGNEISIEIQEKPIDGVEGVFIRIEGPASVAENHITQAEAEVLFEELEKVLKKPQ